MGKLLCGRGGLKRGTMGVHFKSADLACHVSEAGLTATLQR